MVDPELGRLLRDLPGRLRSYRGPLDLSWVVNAAQTRYHVIDLGPIDPKTSPQSSEAWDINNKGSVVGSTTVLLNPNTTYYWRIDEKNGCGTTQGQPWSFTTGSE